jgi:hypothetical protein
MLNHSEDMIPSGYELVEEKQRINPTIPVIAQEPCCPTLLIVPFIYIRLLLSGVVGVRQGSVDNKWDLW